MKHNYQRLAHFRNWPNARALNRDYWPFRLSLVQGPTLAMSPLLTVPFVASYKAPGATFHSG